MLGFPLVQAYLFASSKVAKGDSKTFAGTIDDETRAGDDFLPS